MMQIDEIKDSEGFLFRSVVCHFIQVESVSNEKKHFSAADIGWMRHDLLGY